MARVMIECPNTGKMIYTGMNLNWSTFESTFIGEACIRCPKCGEVHEWRREDVFMDEVGGEG